jgi:SAM-dependent methyltransferase
LLGSDRLEPAFTALAKRWDVARLTEDEHVSAEPGSYDLVVSVLALHRVNDLPGILAQINRVLVPDGLFLAALFGGDTLFELRDALSVAEVMVRGGISPRVSPMADVRQLGGLLQRAGFALPVADVERTVARYPTLRALVRDLRALGETNVLVQRERKSLSRRLLAAAQDRYATHHSDADGRLRATFEIDYLTGWSPHDSQPGPLRPGSARIRLSDALGAKEESAGETVRVPK